MLKNLIVLFALMGTVTKAQAQDPSWVFMDLGEVIVTGNATSGYDFVPGALNLIADLRASGHKVALVSNIPESWGASCAQKFDGLKTFLDSNMNGPQTLDWTLLDKVILPPFDRYRKPKTFMFMSALANACPGKSIFLGESADEIKTAKDLGFATFNTEVEGTLPTQNQIDTLLNNEFSFPYPQNCDFDQLLNDQLDAQDVGLVQSCVHTPN